MSDTGNTVQSIILQIANAVAPLQQELAPGRANVFFKELGISFSPAQEATISAPLAATATNAFSMIQVAVDLTTAIEADQSATILAKTAELIPEIVGLIKGIAGLVTAIEGLGLGLPQATIDAIPERLINLLLVRALDQARGVNEFLELLGILERQNFNANSTDPNNPPYTIATFHFDRVGSWFNSPANILHDLYLWNDTAFTGVDLLQKLGALLSAVGAPAFFDATATPPALDLLLLQVTPKTDVTPKGLSIGLRSDFNTGENDFGSDDWQIKLNLGFTLPFNAALVIQPDGVTFVPPQPGGTYSGNVMLKFIADRTNATDGYILVGQPGGSRLEVRTFEIDVGAGFTWDGTNANGSFSIDGAVSGGTLALSLDDADSFIGQILSGTNIESDFSFGLGYSSDHGLYFTGASSLQIQLPLHLDLGPVQISALTFSVGIQGQQFPIGIAVDIDASLGPLQASVEQIGLEVDLALKDDRSGNAGPIDVSVGFKPPTGAGLSIDAGIVQGGGFLYFDPSQGQYAGVAELSIADVVTVKAIGLITTKMPDGSSGFSLLLILTTDFPPIQLGFGFTLNGVGGLLGLNRSAQLDTLRDGVRTGAVNDIMFPTDIIANAPRIISDLKAIFPPQNNVFLVGPMAQFGWGEPSLVTLSLGIIIEIPPGNIAILGVLRVALPTEDEALILIQVAFIGILDFDEQLLSFDASLYDSHVIFMTLQGDMAVRLKWGDNSAFILSVGGFHPAFHPPDGLHLPATMQRLSISILDYDWAKIKVDCYFAVTSNTVQFGAHLYLFFGVDSANITGQLGLDVLFQFSPFMFIAQISGSLSISVFGMDLMSISLNFQLSGPSPWEAKGTGSLSILFFSISVSFDVTWGEAKNTSLPPVDVMPIFLGEINKQSNWKALPPPSANLLVTLRSVDPSLLVLHPFGSLTLSQRALPLNLQLDKVGNQQPDDVNRVDITQVASGGANLPLSDEDEQFAMAQFQNMSDSDKLSRPSYQDLKGGVIIGDSDSMQSSKMTRRTISYDVTIIDRDPQQPVLKGRQIGISGLFHPFLSGSAAARSPLSYQRKTQLKPFSDTISVGQEGYAVSGTTDNKPVSAAGSFSSEAMARDYMNSQVVSGATSTDAVHVLPNSEVNAP